MAFSPDGKTIASASSDKTAKLWDAETFKQIHTFQGHSEAVISVAFSPDGKTIASASFDKTVKLWPHFNSLNDLINASCNSLRAYLQSNPNVSDSDRTLCYGIDNN